MVPLNDQPSLKSNEGTNTSVPNGRTANGSAIYYDWSGDVEVVVTTATDSNCAHCTASAEVPEGYVLIGGGAYTEKVGAGAFLTESYPDEHSQTWHARSKDHIDSDVHDLVAYSIGLKLKNISAYTLKNNYIDYDSDESGIKAHPSSSESVPYGYKLIGGGARTKNVNYSSGGSLITESYPSGNRWYAKSKDHKRSDPASMVAYAIGIKDYIPGFGYLDIRRESRNSSYTSTGWDDSQTNNTSGWVLASAGGRATYGSKGRLITSIKGDENYVKVVTKDHKDKDGGYTYSYLIKVRKRP